MPKPVLIKQFIKAFFVLLFLAVCFPTHSLKAQTLTKVSANNNYYAECIHFKKSNVFLKKYKVKVYYIPKQEAVLSFTFAFGENVEAINISASGHLLTIETEHTTRVYNVITKAEIKRLSFNAKVILPNYDNFFLVDAQDLRAYDSFTGKEILQYKGAGSRTFDRDVYLTTSDQHIIMRSSANSFYVWKVGESRRAKKFNGHVLRPDHYHQLFTILNNTKLNTYSMKDLSSINEVDLSKLSREFEKSQKNKGQSVQVKTNAGIVSPSGNFVLLPFVNTNKNYQFLFVPRNGLDYKPLKFEFDRADSCRWLNDSALIVHFPKAPSGILYFSGNSEMQETYTASSIKDLSPDKSIAVEQKLGFPRKKLKLTNTLNGDAQKVGASELILFSPNNKTMVVKKGHRKGVIFLDSPDKKFHPFRDSVIPMQELEMVEKDPPRGYVSNQIKQFKHIKDKNDSVPLHLILNSIERNDSIVKVNLHLIDTNGTYFYGASGDEWKTLWCNFVLKNQGKNIRQITNFTITEHQAADSLPCAIMIALDHSGSMGDKRAVLLQKSAKAFIEKKYNADAFGVIKYDTKTRVEGYLSTDKNNLLKYLDVKGLKGFGGGTSMLDAANEGVSMLKNTNKYQRKAVLLLTDGNENSSRISKSELIKRAADNGIKIHCIGFGDNVSEAYLQEISEGTDGSFYHIYKRADFDWIFDDIYKKINNYYEVKFKLEDYGKFLAYLKICYGSRSDILDVELERSEDGQRHPKEKKIVGVDSDVETKLKENISDFSNLSLQKEKPSANIQIPDTVDLVRVEEEFDKLPFPNIKFKLDLSEIIPGTDKGIENVVEFLKRYPFTKIEIAGHTDDDGDNEHNLNLSLQRANAVKKLLESMGVDGKRLIPEGYGEDQPLVPNTTEENRLKNRRVEFVILSN